MTKKKVVVKLSDTNGRNRKCLLFPNFRSQDNRSKALQIATAIPGFQSLSLKGADRDVIEVTGDRVDAFELAKKLRRSVGYVTLVTVEDVKEEVKPQKNVAPKVVEPPAVVTYLPYAHPACIVMEPEPASCIVM